MSDGSPWSAGEQEVIERYQEVLGEGVTGLVDRFFEAQERIPERARVLRQLSPEHYRRLRATHVRHLRGLLAAQDPEVWRAHCLQVGAAHYRYSIPASWITEGHAAHAEGLFRLSDQQAVAAACRPQLRAVLLARLARDLAWQIEGYTGSADAQGRFVQTLDAFLAEAENARAVLQALPALLVEHAGIDAVWLGRPDDAGMMVYEMASGEGMEAYVTRARIGIEGIPGQGPPGQAWRTGTLQVSADWEADPLMAPWRVLGREFGWRSSASIPLRGAERVTDVLTLYSRVPGFFGQPRTQVVIRHLASALGLALERLRAGEAAFAAGASVRALLAGGGLRVLYQPIVELRSGAVVGVEALARLQEGARMRAPHEFLPLLSASDRREMARGVLAQALADLDALGADAARLAVSVNVDPDLVTADHALEWLGAAIRQTGAEPGRITLELLEGSEFQSLEGARDRLFALKALGVKIALDDVGTAYSSLLRLKELPVDKVKLDQGFVRTLSDRPEDLRFVKSIFDLASGLGVEFVAEGVETPEILDGLAALGVELGQGYAIARPLAPDALGAWLRRDLAAPWDGPTSMLGFVGFQIRYMDALRTLLSQAPELMRALPLADADRCPLHPRIARLHLEHTVVDRAHREFHDALAVILAAPPGTCLQDFDVACTRFTQRVQAAFRIRPQ